MPYVDDLMKRRLDMARRRALPIPWEPPIPIVRGLPRRVYRDLVAEAVRSRLVGVVPVLEDAGLDGCAFEIDRVVRILRAATLCTAEVA